MKRFLVTTLLVIHNLWLILWLVTYTARRPYKIWNANFQLFEILSTSFVVSFDKTFLNIVNFFYLFSIFFRKTEWLQELYHIRAPSLYFYKIANFYKNKSSKYSSNSCSLDFSSSTLSGRFQTSASSEKVIQFFRKNLENF